MTLQMLCEKIGLPGAVTARVLSVPAVPEEILCQLRTPELWPLGRAALNAHLKPDGDGLKELAGHLQCALKTWEIYQERGISEEIYVQTMKWAKREGHRARRGHPCVNVIGLSNRRERRPRRSSRRRRQFGEVCRCSAPAERRGRRSLRDLLDIYRQERNRRGGSFFVVSWRSVSPHQNRDYSCT